MEKREEDYESRFLTTEQLKELDSIMKEFEKEHLIYAPSSINHGWKNGGHFKNETLLRVEIGRLYEFIDFLFQDDEYCDHANESEAWDEFYQWEYKKLLEKESDIETINP